MSHRSLFSYPVTRPYPYTWFTPVAIGALVFFTILFSLLNFVSTGYTLVTHETLNPNATVDEHVWKPYWPSWLTKNVQPTCRPAELAVGRVLFTNQTALTYTLTDIWQPSAGRAGGAGTADGITPRLAYYNNVLENCTVHSIGIDFASTDRTATQYAFSDYGAVVRSFATCAMTIPNGTLNVNLTQEYDYVPSTVSFANLYQFLGTNFLSRNKSERASLYWGESLLSMYWASTTHELATIRDNQTSSGNPGIDKGMLFFRPNPDQSTPNITADDFFTVDHRFLQASTNGTTAVLRPETSGRQDEFISLPNLISSATYPNIWHLADILAKAAYSTILTDLGQPSTTTNDTNLLLTPETLTHFTKNFTILRRAISNAYPGPAVRPYGTEATGSLGTTPSTFSTRYLCTIPERKPAGTIFVAVLVADLVMLQALWWLGTAVLGVFALRRRPGAMECVGCSTQLPAPLLRGASGVGAVGGGYRAVEKAEEADGLEMGGLRMRGQGGELKQGRRSSSSSRSVSQERLLNPVSMDIGRL
ncbi:hypothetical protein B0A50_04025 [Salinomyces thailandicus]|uniref:Transmembrane protein n=1 Tax=Salinomyces thailandicus TaxID=706561 RepID=A0A4V5N701_9PEZI|nr:hypothetical protein B0A50_04025 [Salinomyces thailandica]